MSDESKPEIKIVGYCRICGTGLDEANVRTFNGTIYCAEHVPAQETAGSTASGAGSSGPGQQQTYQSAYAHSPYTAPPPGPSGNSPGAAFVLGLIPGVGAIYNGQYVKGAVHIIILALLIAASNESGGAAGPLIGLFITGFWFYMAFEAYHTARRLRDGLPVDDFSGLSDKGTNFPVMAVLLIVLGAILLLDNLGLLDLRRLLRFWPAGLIALGAYMLWLRAKESGNDSK